MKNCAATLFSFALLFAYGAVHAEGFRMGMEYESEKDDKSGIWNHALTAIPGWDFPKENLINVVEFLYERNRGSAPESDGLIAKERKLFLRLRHDGELSERIGYYIRGGIGRSFNNDRDFNYAYVEPALVFKLDERWEWAFAYRDVNSIDGTPGQHVGLFRLGPNFDLTKNDEIEMRYVEGRGDKNVRSWVLEYVHRF